MKIRIRNPLERARYSAGYLVPFAVAATILGTAWFVKWQLDEQRKMKA